MAGKWFHSLTGLLVSAGLALAQPPEPPPLPHAVPFTVYSITPAPEAPSGRPEPTASTIPWQPEHGPIVRAAAVEVGDAQADPGWSGPVCETCGDGSRFYTRAEYLFWGIRQQSNTPTLAGIVPLGLAQMGMGSLPTGSITSVFGGDGPRISYPGASGGRFTVGYWLDPDQDWAIEGSFFQLAKVSDNFSGSTLGGPSVIGPVFNGTDGNQTIILPGDATRQTTAVAVNATNQLWGGEMNLRHAVPAFFFADRLELFAGLRYLQFDEGLNINSSIMPVPGSGLPSGTTFDNISVHSRFYGPQIGLTSRWFYHNFFVEGTGKFGIGVIEQQANINGGTGVQFPGQMPMGFPGGVLAQPTNSGSFDRGKFSELAEFNLSTGYQVASGIRILIGYNFLFVNNVLRSSNVLDQVDSRGVPALNLGTPRPPDVTQPGVSLRESRFWAYGLNTGLEFRY